MGEIIRIREQYEMTRKRILVKYRNCTHQEHRVKLANDLNHLDERWSAVLRHSGRILCNADRPSARSRRKSASVFWRRPKGRWLSE